MNAGISDPLKPAMAQPPAEKDPPVRWRLRSDLSWCRPDEDSATWTIKDPVRLSYFYLQNDEMSFLKLLDGRRGFAAIHGELERIYPNAGFTVRNLQTFLMSAIHARLLVSLDPGFGNHLAAVEHQKQSQRILAGTMSLLTYRFRGIDPGFLFRVIHPLLSWIYHRFILRALIAFAVFSFSVLLLHADQFTREMSLIQLLLSPQNLLWLIGAVVLVKILHELGHGLTCHHYGGECHELGCIMIAFVPLLYCDVSDSWRQPRRHRIAVASAGIITELFVAAVFSLLWVMSVPGIARTFFLNMVVVCSLNTIIINANPLMRYDGYYVLCDLLRFPNLGNEARICVERLFDRIVLGLPAAISSGTSAITTLGLTAYGLLSLAYRWFVTFALVWTVYMASRPYGLEAPAALVGGLTILGLALGVFQWVRQRLRAVSQGVTRWMRAGLGTTLLVTVILVAVLIPLPHRITVPFVLGPGTSVPVFVTVAGYIRPAVSVGEPVTQGQVLAVLSSPELDTEIERAQAELDVAVARLEHLTRTRTTSGPSSDAIPAARKVSDAARERLRILQQKREDLTVRSPCQGRVIAPRNTIPETDRQKNNAMWWGSPISSENTGVWLEPQTLLCWVGTPDQVRADCLVPEQDIELVRSAAKVDLMSDAFPKKRFPSRTVSVSTTPEVNLHREFIVRQLIPLRPGRMNEPAETSFMVQAAIDPADDNPLLPLYSTGTATIHCDAMSVAHRMRRLLFQTFAIRE
jgi:putative peptide zinc metalloprotease protein